MELQSHSQQFRREMFKKTIVYQHEQGLMFRSGALVGVVGPGEYRTWGQKTRIERFDMRQRQTVIGAQDVMTADMATFRVSMWATYRISNLDQYYKSMASDASLGSLVHSMAAQTLVHNASQVALRDWIAPLTMDEALEKRGELAAALLNLARERIAGNGLEIVDVVPVDFGLTGSLKTAKADLLKADLEGKVALQRARNEAATLRSLLNSARLTREHPGLLELRILSTGQKPRVTFMVGPSDQSPIVNESES